MKLSQLKKMETATIVRVEVSSEKISQRLADFGLKEGQKITCLFKSPLGGVNSYRLSHGAFALEDILLENITVSRDPIP